jgi:guanosine-3',5'-bis(diphosphate) 3'-pyrophosphohydrolase
MMKTYAAIPATGERVIYRGQNCEVGQVMRSDAAPVSGWLVELNPSAGQGISETGAYGGFVDAASVQLLREITVIPETDGLGLIIRAIAFAADKHREQRRKDADATPYINHPIALANVLKEEGGITDPVVLAAAILHDTIEDTETTAYELEKLFGQEITKVVLEVTDDKGLDKAVRKQLQVEHAATASHQAKLVKLADKICNLRDIASNPPADWSEERKREYYKWAAKVVEGCRGKNASLEAAFDNAFDFLQHQ